MVFYLGPKFYWMRIILDITRCAILSSDKINVILVTCNEMFYKLYKSCEYAQ